MEEEEEDEEEEDEEWEHEREWVDAHALIYGDECGHAITYAMMPRRRLRYTCESRRPRAEAQKL